MIGLVLFIAYKNIDSYLDHRLAGTLAELDCVQCEQQLIKRESRSLVLVDCRVLCGSVDAKIDSVFIGHIHIPDLLSGDGLSAKSIFIDIDSLNISKDSVLSTLSHQSVSFDEAELRLSHFTGQDRASMVVLQDVEMSLQQVKLGESSIPQADLMAAKSATGSWSSGSRSLSWSSILLDDGRFVASGCDGRYGSLNSRSEMSYSARTVSATPADDQGLISGNILRLDSVQVDDWRLDVKEFADRPRCKTADCEKTFPHETLYAPGAEPIDIPYIALRRGDIDYNLVDQGRTSQNISFKNIYGSIYGLSNQSNKSKLQMDIVAGVFDDAHLDLSLSFARSGVYSYAGEIGSFDLTYLNPILLSDQKLQIREGRADVLRFEVKDTANNLAQIDYTFAYSGLKLKSVRKKDRFVGLIEEGLANLHLKSAKKNRRDSQTEQFSQRRQIDRSIFWHMADIFATGMIQSLE